ncbi:MAG TPA: peptide ABC transporter substrate-binding protein [Candidatus Paceibacterota bacterium]|nr:peptide ABC transporter substrate-binding protein [Candidatus Paceibacterota bacterium]HRY77007.1 peptide ABC transporter substrate-binding protein [Candidatus Paceibacterota bacterium]
MNLKSFFSRSFWRKFWEVLSPVERKILKAALIVLIFCLVYFLIKWYYTSTILVPEDGGTLREGLSSQPTSLNPILSQNEVDQDLASLVFSGILKSDGKGGLENDLADSVERSDDGKIWTVKLRQDVFWQDGQQLTADDVLFTIQAIQDQESRSPWRLSWQGVEVKKFNDFTVIFELKNPFAFFEEKLKQKIIPQHIFGNIPLTNLYLSDYNFQPVGSGPYIFEKFEKGKSGFINYYQFKANPNYFLSRPHIDKLVIKFYKSEPELITAFNHREIDLLSGLNIRSLDSIKRSFKEDDVTLPRYFAVFFNQSISKVLSDKNVRYALNYAVDRLELIDKVFQGKAQSVEGPILAGMIGYDPELKFEYSLDKAASILAKDGWSDENGDGILEKKLNKNDSAATPLSFKLVSPESPALIEAASLLKNQWAKIGANVDIQIVSALELQQNYLEPRVYDALIYGNVLNQNPDPFQFWHSSQKFHPGFNLALYENAAVDKVLEDFRQIFDSQLQAADLRKFQSFILADAPAVFLFNPQYPIISAKNVYLTEMSRLNIAAERYFDVQDWYVQTRRAFKTAD